MHLVFVTVMVVCSALLAVTPASAQISRKSETCREVAGKTQKDADNALAFCSGSIPKDLDVQGVIAMESLVWVKVSRTLANVMRGDKLATEQVVKNWMNAWKRHSGSKAVTVYVEWQDVEIAKGETTMFSGDKVTIR